MKRLCVFIIAILTLYAVYFDFTRGTLPVEEKSQEASISVNDTEQSYFEKKVGKGETILTIIEKKIEGPLPVSIDTVITDFKTLNDEIEPEALQSGKTYKFPIYSR